MIDIRSYPNYHSEEILPLYVSVGWTSYTCDPDALRRAFEGSLAVWAAYDQETLVGLIRVVGDGVSILYIQDLLVEPMHQRRGIGRRLLQAVLQAYPTVRQKLLLTDTEPSSMAFYRASGFKPVADMHCTALLHSP